MAIVAPSQAITLQASFPGDWSLADLHNYLGGIPLTRLRVFPPPGYATADDVLAIQEHEDRLYELSEGILVEKTVGWYESLLAGLILTRLNVYLETHDIGLALGADGLLQVLPGLVRIPDVSFLSWERLPAGTLPRRPIPALVPDLVVEVLSEGNTSAEMEAKLRIYFQAGVRLIWYVDPSTHTATVYTSPADAQHLHADGVLNGGDVLPGFQLSLRHLFATAERRKPS